MKFKDTLTEQEKQLFKDAVGKIKPMVSDTIHPVKKSIKSKHKIREENNAKQQASFHFSDQYEPDLATSGPVKYCRDSDKSYEVKKLRRGIYQPDLILDLHGLDQQEAKHEIAALLFTCQKEHAQCICIVHGIGNRILKNKVPHWLVQHPDVIAFHQAPLEWGGNGALLALIEIHDNIALKEY